MPNLFSLDTFNPISRQASKKRQRRANCSKGRRRLLAEQLEQRHLLAVDYSLIDTNPDGFPTVWPTAVVGNDVYYAEADPVHGLELHKFNAATGENSLVVDINPGIGDSLVGQTDFAAVGTKLFFGAYDSAHGYELRWIDTAEETPSLHTMDLFVGPESSDAGLAGFAVSGSKLYFTAYRAYYSSDELFWIDTSLDDPILNKIDTPNGFLGFRDFTLVGGDLYFSAGKFNAGTFIGSFDTASDLPTLSMTDLGLGNNLQQKSFQDGLFRMGSKLYFTTIENNTFGLLHWIDTVDATRTVHDVMGSEGQVVSQTGMNGGFTTIGNRFFFSGYDPVSGLELRWIDFVNDPSTIHTVDINSGRGDSWPGGMGNFAVAGSKLYFTVSDPNLGWELCWIDTAVSVSDVHLIDIYPGFSSSSPGFNSGYQVIDGILYFAAADGSVGDEIRWLDTKASAPEVHTINLNLQDASVATSGGLIRVGQRIAFTAKDDTQQYAFYSVTNSGGVITTQRAEIYAGDGYSNPYEAIKYSATIGSKLYFISRTDAEGNRIRWIDTTLAVPEVHVIDIPLPSIELISEFTAVGSKLFYFEQVNGVRVLNSIDTSLIQPAKYSIVVDNDASSASVSFEMIGVGNKLYFNTEDAANGLELAWIDLDSPEPTVHPVQINPNAASSNPGSFYAVDNRLYFIATDALQGTELRWIDTLLTPSFANTIDFYAGVGSSFDDTKSTKFITVGKKLFFTANDPGNQNRLRFIDTQSIPVIIKTVGIHFAGQAAQIKDFAQVGDKIYVVATDNDHRDSLFWFDAGSDNPTAVLVSTQYEAGDVFGILMPVGDMLYVANKLNNFNSYFFVSIDTVNSPSTADLINDPVINLDQGRYRDQPGATGYTVVDNTLYFLASNDMQGMELRVLDTINSPTKIETIDLTPRYQSGFDFSPLLVNVNNKLYFAGTKPGFGWELFVIKDNNPNQTNIELSQSSVQENLSIGTSVGTLSTPEAGGSNGITYTLISGEGDADNDAFRIQGNELKTKRIFDFETRKAYSIRVRSTDQFNDSVEQIFTISVGDVNEFSVSSPVDSNNAQNSLPENSSVGTLVGITAKAIDSDGSNSAIAYSLINSAGGRFAIDPVTGVVTVATASLNYEVLSAFTITVQAQSDDGSTATADFTINLTDVNEFYVSIPIDIDSSPNSVPENSPVGTVVGLTAKAVDVDGTNNAVTYSLTNSAGGRFAIDPVTGVLSVAVANLNYESQSSFSITIMARSADNSTDTSNFIISITDVNEFDVTVPVDTNNAANSLAENSGIGTLVGITAKATDGDGTNNLVTYSLSDSAGGRFAINSSSGNVTLATANLNYEAQSSFTITIQAKSRDNSTSTASFTINVTDVDEFDVTSPADANNASNNLPEYALVGALVGITAKATDADGTFNAVTYSLVDSASGRFAIDPLTGVVTLAIAGLDYEALASYTINVKASSVDGSTATADFTINVTDVDEFDVTAPVDTNVAANSLPENSAVGAVVGVTSKASDADGTNNSVTYSMSDSAGGRFAIDPTTGVVTLATANLNYEAQTSWTIKVQAKSADGSTATTNFIVDVTEVDEFDVSSPVDSNNAANSLPENAAIGTLVGITAKASDADGTNNVITYSLTDSANGRFAIDPATGVVSLAIANLDYEALNSYVITIQAKSADGSTATNDFTVGVADVDEIPVAVADSFQVAADRMLIVTAASSVLSNDQRADEDNLIAQLVSQPTKGFVAFNADGTFAYTPAANAVAGQSDVFSYSVSESDGSVSAPTNVTIQLLERLGSPLRNKNNPLDVNPGTSAGTISSLDVLAILNVLNAHRGRPSLPVAELAGSLFFYDVNGDYVVSSLDVLAVINFLNQRLREGGEGERDGLSHVESASGADVKASLVDAAIVDLTELPNKRRAIG